MNELKAMASVETTASRRIGFAPALNALISGEKGAVKLLGSLGLRICLVLGL